MRNRLNFLARLGACLGAAAVSACSTPMSGLSSGNSLAAFHPIAASKNDTCPTQKAIAEHNSVYDSLKSGKVVAYKAACETKKPAQELKKAPADGDVKDPKLS